MWVRSEIFLLNSSRYGPDNIDNDDGDSDYDDIDNKGKTIPELLEYPRDDPNAASDNDEDSEDKKKNKKRTKTKNKK